jgi:hypothetical protein
MSRRGEKALEIGVRQDHGGGVDQRVRLHGIGLPQGAVDDEFDGVRMIIGERQQADRARRDAEVPRKPLGRCEAQPSAPSSRLER